MQVVAMLRRGLLGGSLGQEPPGQREQTNRLPGYRGTCVGIPASPRGSGGWEQRGRGQRSEVRGQAVKVTEKLLSGSYTQCHGSHCRLLNRGETATSLP